MGAYFNEIRVKEAWRYIIMLLTQEIRNHVNTCIHLIYSAQCVMCETTLQFDEKYICHACQSKIAPLREPLCRKCACELAPFLAHTRRMCSSCASKKFYYTRCLSVIRYDELTKRVLHEVKFKKRRSLMNIFNEQLRRQLARMREELITRIVIPVPLDHKRKYERQFNQSELLAKKISRFCRLPYTSKILKRIKKGIPQSMLNRKERLSNLAGAFMVQHKKAIEAKKLLLFDDVFTTGSTVNECAKVLMDAGARDVTVFTLARAI